MAGRSMHYLRHPFHTKAMPHRHWLSTYMEAHHGHGATISVTYSSARRSWPPRVMLYCDPTYAVAGGVEWPSPMQLWVIWVVKISRISCMASNTWLSAVWWMVAG